MANIAPPKQKKPSPIAQAVNDDERVTEEKKKTMNFLFEESFHLEVKTYAASRGMSMNKLFREMYRFYRENHD